MTDICLDDIEIWVSGGLFGASVSNIDERINVICAGGLCDVRAVLARLSEEKSEAELGPSCSVLIDNNTHL